MTASTQTRAERLADARTWAGYRSAHFARETGTLVVVYRDEDADPTQPWISLCDDHGQLVSHDTLALAQSHASNPLGWCEICNGQDSYNERLAAIDQEEQ